MHFRRLNQWSRGPVTMGGQNGSAAPRAKPEGGISCSHRTCSVASRSCLCQLSSFVCVNGGALRRHPCFSNSFVGPKPFGVARQCTPKALPAAAVAQVLPPLLTHLAPLC